MYNKSWIGEITPAQENQAIHRDKGNIKPSCRNWTYLKPQPFYWFKVSEKLKENSNYMKTERTLVSENDTCGSKYNHLEIKKRIYNIDY